MISVPAVAIGGLLIYKIVNRPPKQVVVEAENPNENIEALQRRFEKLRSQAYQVIQKLRTDDRESKRTAEVLKSQLDSWLREFDAATSDLRDENGEWARDYQGFSKLRASASLLRMDLIKTGNL